MSIDLAFELSYLLSDVIGKEVTIKDYSFDPEAGTLCVSAEIEDKNKTACIEIKQCKKIPSETKQFKCIVRTLASNEELLRRLAELLQGG
ncbi:hypothetical protein PYJP_07530 [Pyrofollis japonicus]|uniref:hypothetical protein n=1 Tax=Pyrofollis japonicus TaxID=3060460 RepID=UPI00295B1CD3|nr:hypothetical protein [Pyrofollis japonicus]BEP17401.1 hypothetical protein PYJP_07530 [Pyrofollis japonicus]